jgi:hypothetical protein
LLFAAEGAKPIQKDRALPLQNSLLAGRLPAMISMTGFRLSPEPELHRRFD